MKEEQEKNKFLEEQAREKSELIEQLQPKASYYDLILQCKDLLTIREIAKDYGMTANKMNKVLAENKIQYLTHGRWFLYSKYDGNGYVQSKTQPIVHRDGTPGYSTHMYWTQKGRLFLYDKLKQFGIVPEIESEAS